jgi:hypothetical protein
VAKNRRPAGCVAIVVGDTMRSHDKTADASFRNGVDDWPDGLRPLRRRARRARRAASSGRGIK